MQINITARHGHLSEATKSKLTAKMEKLSRVFERLMMIELIVDLEHEESPTAELKVSAEHKHDFVATERSESLMAAVDECVHKLEQQLRKYKEKVVERHRAPGAKHADDATPPKGKAN